MAILNFPPTAGEPIDGSFTYSSDGVTYSWDGYKWTADTGSGGGGDANHSDGPTPPTTGELADQWYNTDDGRLYTYTADESGALVWIDASPDSIAGGSGGSGDGTTVNYNGASAWGRVQADGTLEGSFNVASISAVPTGLYDVVFTTPMSTDDYAISVSAANPNPSAGAISISYEQVSVNGFRVRIKAGASFIGTEAPFSFAVHSANAIAPQSGVGADAWGDVKGSSGNLNGGYNCTASKNSTGNYRVTFLTSMPNTSYGIVFGMGKIQKSINFQNKTTAGFDVETKDISTNVAEDRDFAFTVHASSTVTPTYTWTRDGTTLKPANAGDNVFIEGQTRSNKDIVLNNNLGLDNEDTPAITVIHDRGGGVTNPSFRVLADGTLYLGDKGTGTSFDADPAAIIRPNGSAQFTNEDSGSDPAIAVERSGNINFAVQRSGQVTIGPDALSSPNISLRANGGASFNEEIYSYRPGTGTASIMQWSSDSGGTGSQVAKITRNGQFSAVSTTISSITSERRLKENISPIDSGVAWETIKSTPYYAYNFIGAPAESVCYGPMADEVPVEMVVQPMEENEAGVMVARSDEQGPIRTFDNGMLQARLYVALQTALTRIETLEAEVQALKGGNN